MPSKPKTTATTEEAKPALVPKLRFPEFRGKAAWDSDLLGNLAEMRSGGTPPSSVPEYYDGDIPWVSIADMTKAGKYIASTDRNLSRVGLENCSAQIFPSGTVLFAMYASIGECSITRVALCSSQAILGIRPTGLLDNEFLYYYLTLLKPRLRSLGQHGTQANLNKNIVQSLTFPLPPPAEQQKIAECLSSVDEVIAAQARKLDALKTHKKGLMQQLFPREGETQPRLRFPGFQNAGAWEVRTIGDMFDLINGCAFKPEDWKATGTPIIRIQNLNDPSAEFNYSQEPVPERNRVEPGDLLFAWSGTLGSSFGARIWNGPSGVLNQHIFKVLMDEKEIALHFALLVLAKVEDDIARRTHGFKVSFVHVKKSDLVKVEMLLPTLPEQHRIATCLFSLDALIAAETQKHAALQRHKRGLMQQLFPTAELNQ